MPITMFSGRRSPSAPSLEGRFVLAANGNYRPDTELNSITEMRAANQVGDNSRIALDAASYKRSMRCWWIT
jgi:hypothetical protein